MATIHIHPAAITPRNIIDLEARTGLIAMFNGAQAPRLVPHPRDRVRRVVHIVQPRPHTTDPNWPPPAA